MPDLPWSIDTPTLLPIGGAPVASSIEVAGDRDAIRVELTAGVTYVFEARSLGLPDPYLYLYDSALTLLGRDDDGAGGYDARITYTATASGSYYLGVTDFGGGTGNYTVTATTTTDDFPWSANTPGLVSVGAPAATGLIESANDLDMLRVDLVIGQVYEIGLVGNGLPSPRLFVYDDTLHLVTGGEGASERIAPSISGTYYLGVADAGTGTGAYTLAVQGMGAIAGSSGHDTLEGTLGPDAILGSAGNDTIYGRGGDDFIDGGDGFDVARFSGARSDAGLSWLLDGRVRVHGGDGEDTLVHVERLAFRDGSLALDLDGHAGIVARTLGAVFGPASLANEEYVGIGLSLLDGGMSETELTRLALELRLGTGASDTSVVQLLYTNVAGAAPDEDTLWAYTDALERGAYTLATLGTLAAHHAANEVNIGLVALAVQGLAYH